MHGPARVPEVALQLAEDRRHGVARERGAARGVVAVDGLHEPDARHLDEVVEWLVPALIAPRQLAGKGQEALDELVARLQVSVAVVPGQEPAILTRPGLGACGGRSRWQMCAKGRGRVHEPMHRSRFAGYAT